MTDADAQAQVQAEIRDDVASRDPVEEDPATRREGLENECRDDGEPPGGHDIGQPID